MEIFNAHIKASSFRFVKFCILNSIQGNRHLLEYYFSFIQLPWRDDFPSFKGKIQNIQVFLASGFSSSFIGLRFRMDLSTIICQQFSCVVMFDRQEVVEASANVVLTIASVWFVLGQSPVLPTDSHGWWK